MKAPKENEEKKATLNAYFRYISLVFQMGALIAGGAYGGKWLDAEQGTHKPWFTMLGTLLGLGTGLYLIIKAIQNDSRA